MKKIFLILFLMLFGIVNAQTFDFSKAGDKKANEIMADFVKQEMPEFYGDVVAYFYDIDSMGEDEILGIVKSKVFYTLKGYKLVVLKMDAGFWTTIENDIFFDPAQEFEVNNKKIIYHGSVFYKNRKYKAKIKNGKIKLHKSLSDRLFDRKAHNIEEITEFVHVKEKNVINFEQFPKSEQRNVNIHYENLHDKTKHYLYMK